MSDVQLARAAAAAVRGRVEDVTAGWDEDARAIYTWVTIAADRTWGLDGAPTRLVVKQLGGVVGATALIVADQATFTPGEPVFVLLDVRPRDRTLSVAGLSQGKWTLDAPASGLQTRSWRRAPGSVRSSASSSARLDALAALVGQIASASGAALAPARPAIAGDRDARVTVAVNLGGIAGRWHEADDSVPVMVDTDGLAGVAFPLGPVNVLDQALGAWRSAGSLRLEPGIVRGPRCFANSEPADGRISVTHDDPCDEIADTSPVLAIGGAYYSAGDVRDVGGRSFWKLTKGMVVVDGAGSKTRTLGPGCVADLVAHEIGHAIGLDHIDDPLALMSPTLSPTCASRSAVATLAGADRDAMRAAYPRASAGSGPTDPPMAPSGLSAVTVGRQVTLAWTASTADGPVTYELLVGSRPGGSDLAIVPLTSTTLYAPAVAEGVYYVRLVARNAVGASPPTADLRVLVSTTRADARAPGVPVTLTWLPPADVVGPMSFVVLGGPDPGDVIYRVTTSAPFLDAGRVREGAFHVRVMAMTPAGLRGVTPDTRLVVPNP